ncbi:MAG: phosphatase PAP2 family protein [Paludibacteraceae bacterium]|nr:phosphatase PAP2 family protein [Paludibacteraceae bacterium]
MLEELIEIDKDIFLSLNGLRCGWADTFMWWFSQSVTWIPLAVILAIVIIKAKKRESIWILLAIGFTVLLADQLSSGLIKNVVERLRPTHEPSLQGLVHTVNGYVGGKYGFVSSHAANTIGIAVFTMLLFKDRVYSVAILLWALTDAYSRIYLGVHYPGDILGGLVVGIFSAIASFALLKALRPQSLYLSRTSVGIDERNGFSQPQIALLTSALVLSVLTLCIVSFF